MTETHNNKYGDERDFYLNEKKIACTTPLPYHEIRALTVLQSGHAIKKSIRCTGSEQKPALVFISNLHDPSINPTISATCQNKNCLTVFVWQYAPHSWTISS